MSIRDETAEVYPFLMTMQLVSLKDKIFSGQNPSNYFS
jgi:hypothetical protein